MDKSIIGFFCVFLIHNVNAYDEIPEDDASELDTVTVIGQKAVQDAEIGGADIKKLPINSHVVNQAEIDRIKFVDPDEFLDRIPGETQVRNLRIPNGGKSYTIPLLDGMPLESPYEGATQRLDRVNTGDIRRIEVIKGPASALYPNNAFGGVVNVVTRETPENNETKVWLESGNLGRQRFGVNSGGSNGKLGYFVDANSRNLDGQREQARNDRDQFSGKLTVQALETARLSARYEYLKEDVVTRGDLTREQILENPNQAGGINSATDLEQQTISLKWEQLIGNADIDFSLVGREKNTIGLSRFRGPQDENDNANSSKFTYRYDFDVSNFILGFETYNGEQNTDQYDRNDEDLNGAFIHFDNHLDIRAYFAQYQVSPIQRLTVTAGVRYEDIQLKSSLFPTTADFTATAPKLGFTWEINPTNLLWLGLSEGFYAPDLDDLFNLENGNSFLKPEEAVNIEIGLRGHQGPWHYDSSIYHNKIKNYLVTQEFEENGVEYELTTNAGQVTVAGVESVIEYAPLDANWRMGLTHTYAKNIYDSFISSRGDYTGNELSRSPRNHVNARVAWLPVDGLVVELEGDFYSSYFSDNNNSPAGKFKRGERVNIRLTYDRGQWGYWLNALNLTDTIEDRATFRRGKMYFRTADGRALYAGVSYRF